MPLHNVVLPSKPKIVREEDFTGIYEIDSLYPGYGHTLGNSLRRIILSSLPGAAITQVKINGVSHEFSAIPVSKRMLSPSCFISRKCASRCSPMSHELTIKVKGVKEVKASDIKAPGQIEILNPDLVIAHLTEKNADLTIEMRVEKGLGFVSNEVLMKYRVDYG